MNGAARPGRDAMTPAASTTASGRTALRVAHQARHIAVQSMMTREHSAAKSLDLATRSLLERAAGMLADTSVLLQRASESARDV